ncbi:MAG: ferrochelatase [Gammaproteobacteria bacterium RIFCSPHIGHO2_12_FULL_37_14]|nr:MAG: ferrochelatase [Gammaproteobacteria bacterium RIFCSPHIGHO2_12_FULL_37_14]
MNASQFSHSIGILLTNTGTPNAPTKQAVRRYLREFLSDKHVVQLPRWLWLPILYGLILPTRPRQSAKLYEQIWTKNGSPLRVIMQELRAQLRETLLKQSANPIEVAIGMNYGQPSIQQGIEELLHKNVKKIIINPLFPQFSHTTTASSIDRVKKALATHVHSSSIEISFIETYAIHEQYLNALASSVSQFWSAQKEAHHLLISFHGIPERFILKGDPYQSQCQQTAQLLANKLKLPSNAWTICYQSRFGYSHWLKPSTQKLFTELPMRGIKHVDVICPGFAVDCLETLEEIAIRGKKLFIEAGGETLRYIPALNASQAHIDLLIKLIGNPSTHASEKHVCNGNPVNRSVTTTL